MTEAVLPHPSPAATPTRFPLLAEAALVGAAAVNLVLFAIGSAAGGAMAVHWPIAQAIAAPIVVVATLAPTTVAAIATWQIERHRPGFARFAARAGVAVALVSMAAPLVAGDDLTTRLLLAPMHLVVGAAWCIAAGRIARRA